MELELKKLQQILTVARRGSFSRAAEELHITQPALSRSIAAFEEQFGVRLFERGRGGAALTPTGKTVAAQAETLLRSARALQHNLRLYGRGDAGSISVGMGPLVSSVLMPSMSSHMLTERSALKIRTVVKPAQALLQDLLDDHIELLLCARVQLPPSDELRMETIGQLPLSFIVRSGHPLSGERAVTQRDLEGYPILTGAEMSLQGLGKDRGGLIFDNYHILRETTLKTDGVWMSSPQLVEEDLAAGLLQLLRVVENLRPTRTDICLVSRRECQPSPAAQVIARYVREFFGRQGQVDG